MPARGPLVLRACCLVGLLHGALALHPARRRHRRQDPVPAPRGPVPLNATSIAWLHIPKTGMSFANTILTWGCPRFPEYTWIGKNCGQIIKCDAGVPWRNCGRRWPCGVFAGMKRYFGHTCVKDFNFGFEQGHHPIDGSAKMQLSDHRGSFLTMLRQPEQRLISGFYHRLHGYPHKHASIDEYARHMSGCATRMIVGRQCNEGTTSHEEVSQAIHRVENAFAFVGLVEEWELTVCLFHRMFGGRCHQREFLNVRPGVNKTGAAYNTSVLGGFTDEFDGRLYTSVQKLFWSNVRKFGVNHTTCAKTCPVANFFQPGGMTFAFDPD